MIQMAKLINPGVWPINLPAGQVIPSKGELVTTNDIIRGDNFPTLSGMILSGAVAVEYDPEPVVDGPEAEVSEPLPETEAQAAEMPPEELAKPAKAKAAI